MSELFLQLTDIIGILGVLLVLTAYFLLTLDRLSPKSMVYLILNCIGSSLIAFSLCFDWNLPSFLIEVAWAMISLMGIYRYIRT